MKAATEFAPVVLVFVVLPAWLMWEKRGRLRGWHLWACAILALAAVGALFAMMPGVRSGGWGALVPLMGALVAGAVAVGAVSCLLFGALFKALVSLGWVDAPEPAMRERADAADQPESGPPTWLDRFRTAFRAVVFVVLPTASLFGVRDATVRAMVWCGVGAVVVYFVWVVFMPREDDRRTRRRPAAPRRAATGTGVPPSR